MIQTRNVRKGKQFSSLEELVVDKLKAGGGDIPAEKLREIDKEITSAEEHDEFHELLDTLIESGMGRYATHVTRIGDKGLVISTKLRVRPRQHAPTAPHAPIIVARKRELSR
jgi:hypothetical protein